MSTDKNYWRVCTTCRIPMAFGSDYYRCSVSTCQRRTTGYTFCSPECHQAHVPVLNHREAWAEPQVAPTRAQWDAQLAEQAREARPARGEEHAPAARPAATAPLPPGTTRIALREDDLPEDILIVASKLKAYVRARSGMNTSDGVMQALSDLVREWTDDAIRRAAADERKTVMDRDFPAQGRAVTTRG